MGTNVGEGTTVAVEISERTHKDGSEMTTAIEMGESRWEMVEMCGGDHSGDGDGGGDGHC